MSTHRLAELLGALSLATDGANGMPPETALRTAIVAVSVGRASGVQAGALHDVYMTALLRFLGCTAHAHETARYGGGDDQAVLRAVMTADAASPVDILSRVARGLGESHTLAERAVGLARLATDPRAAESLVRAHCELAAALAARLGVGEGVARALGQVFERSDGRGGPDGLAGEAIDLTARIVVVAFRIVTYHTLEGRAAAVNVVRSRRGTELDPRFADAFLDVATETLAAIEGDSVWERFLEAEPRPIAWIGAEELMGIAEAFADYADMKSPFTLGHSRGVAALADRVAQDLGVSAEERSRLHLAALLHDIGRVAIPNGIWDKPGPLGAIERERVETHALHTARILGRSPLFAQVATIAAGAHERADGGGYPRGIPAELSPLPARVLAVCDVLHALGEARAHRPARGREAAAEVLAEEARAGRLDGRVVRAALTVSGSPAREPRLLPDGLSEREVEVLCLLARGLSNKEIAAQLGISAKTVQHHVAHVYEKTAARTRAAAAIYATSRRLLER